MEFLRRVLGRASWVEKVTVEDLENLLAEVIVELEKVEREISILKSVLEKNRDGDVRARLEALERRRRILDEERRILNNLILIKEGEPEIAQKLFKRFRTYELLYLLGHVEAKLSDIEELERIAREVLKKGVRSEAVSEVERRLRQVVREREESGEHTEASKRG